MKGDQIDREGWSVPLKYTNGHYRLDHAVTKKQKTILSAFGLSDTDVKSIAVEIGNQLSGEQTPTDKAPEEDDDYGEDTFTIID